MRHSIRTNLKRVEILFAAFLLIAGAVSIQAQDAELVDEKPAADNEPATAADRCRVNFTSRRTVVRLPTWTDWRRPVLSRPWRA